MWVITNKERNLFYCGDNPLTDRPDVAYYSIDKKSAEHKLKLFKNKVVKWKQEYPWHSLAKIDTSVLEVKEVELKYI